MFHGKKNNNKFRLEGKTEVGQILAKGLKGKIGDSRVEIWRFYCENNQASRGEPSPVTSYNLPTGTKFSDYKKKKKKKTWNMTKLLSCAKETS